MMQPGAAFGAFFVLIWLGFVVVGFVGWIVFLVAVWKLMRAHESLAESGRIAIEILDTRSSTQV